MQADQGIYQILRNQTKNVGILKYSLSSLVVGCHDCSQANQNNYQNVLSWDRLGKCIIKHVSYIHTDRCLYICMYTSMNIQNLILGFKPTKRKERKTDFNIAEVKKATLNLWSQYDISGQEYQTLYLICMTEKIIKLNPQRLTRSWNNKQTCL